MTEITERKIRCSAARRSSDIRLSPQSRIVDSPRQ
jgi:hypothetical protein